jgi:hypothetical protein
MKKQIKPKTDTWTLIKENGYNPSDWEVVAIYTSGSKYQAAKNFVSSQYGPSANFIMFADQEGFSVYMGQAWDPFHGLCNREDCYLFFDGIWSKRNALSSWWTSLWLPSLSHYTHFVRRDSEKENQK